MRRFKIVPYNEWGSTIIKFKVYERKTFLGFTYHKFLFKTQYLSDALQVIRAVEHS